MKIKKDLLLRVANNARLNLTDSEIKEFLPQLEEILNAFSILDEVDTSKTKPSFQPIEIKNVLREDVIERCLTQEEALKNTKNKKLGFFKGPKAL